MRGLLSAILCLAVASAARAQPRLTPCEAYGAADAVFIGTARPPVVRTIRQRDHRPFQHRVQPVDVETSFRGVSADVVYLTPVGTDFFLPAGGRYLVYGRAYAPPDVFMAGDVYGLKAVESASEDLAFLQGVGSGASIYGRLEQVEIVPDREAEVRAPIAGVTIRLSSGSFAAEVMTAEDGSFIATGLPAGRYSIRPLLPDSHVVLDDTSLVAEVSDGGCAQRTLRALLNGRIRGRVTDIHGAPVSTYVDLVPLGVERDSSGHIKGAGSVHTDNNGVFEFPGRPAGRYVLGVNLIGAPAPGGQDYPRTFYPGNEDAATAVPVEIEDGTLREGYDFVVGPPLPRSTLTVIVSGPLPKGRVSVCFRNLANPIDQLGERLFPKLNTRLVLPVLLGLRYRVHAHLELQDGQHLESEAYDIEPGPDPIVVRLRPDAARDFHAARR
ncbi:MAG TPA: carboxypeptidase-like regulatory domain-containing protein [Vicinamibacterales bacterium]|nr:carboxypeptidase-like regulatory domain-containing protein [Vicinamibacterales bacterium]